MRREKKDKFLTETKWNKRIVIIYCRNKMFHMMIIMQKK
jgi:hypothetical protein